MPHQSHPPSLDNSNHTWRTIQVMKLLIMQFSPTSYHFIPLRSKYSPQHPVLKQRPSFITIQNHRQNYSFLYSNFYVFRQPSLENSSYNFNTGRIISTSRQEKIRSCLEPGTVQSIQRRVRHPGFDSRQRQHFFLLHTVQTSSGAHRNSYPMGYRGPFPLG
jgi:hypothetical protein